MVAAAEMDAEFRSLRAGETAAGDTCRGPRSLDMYLDTYLRGAVSSTNNAGTHEMTLVTAGKLSTDSLAVANLGCAAWRYCGDTVCLYVYPDTQRTR